MGQTRNNNLSPLPFYGSLAEQECRLPWAFGDVFPLRCDKRLLPFVVMRPASTTPQAGADIDVGAYFSGYLDNTGEAFEPGGYTASGVNDYDTLDGTTTQYWVSGLPAPVAGLGVETVNVVCRDDDGAVLAAFTPNVAGSPYTGVINVPAGTTRMYMQAYLEGEETATLHEVGRVVTPVGGVKVLSPDGADAEDISSVMASVLHVENVGDVDIIWYDGGTPVLTCPYGTYYLKLTDENNYSLYSEMFTYGAVPALCMEWNDVSDLLLPDGKIPYSEGYVNRVWLNTAVGRPEYEIEKEGDERDGYFFMEKGTSRKSYRFTFYAPEYLCDALRLVPVSDIVKIWDTSRGVRIEYDADDADIEVEWLEQGNYASVTLTFRTDTVVKNLGKIIK